MKSNHLLFCLVILFCASLCSAQNIKGHIAADDSYKPNLSKGEIGKDIVNVDLYTGIGSANIPINNYNIDGLNLGVSMSYSAKGIKVDEISSSIGLGWSLDAGGSVMRQMNGLEDDVTLPITYTTAGHTTDSLQGYLTPGANLTFASDPYADDMEQDIYNFSFAGRSIAAVFIRNGSNYTYLTYPNSEVKIEILTRVQSLGGGFIYYSGVLGKNGQLNYSYQTSFKLTDEKGNVFMFDPGTIEYKKWDFPTGSFSKDTGTYYPVQTWDLTKIITYSGKIVTYDYTKKYVKYADARVEQLYPKAETVDPMSPPGNVTFTYDPLIAKDNFWAGMKSHIQRINYPNGMTVDFDVDTNRCDCRSDFRLQRITISGTTGTGNNNTQKYVLNQAYFNNVKYGYNQKEIPYGTSCSLIKSYLTGTSLDSAKEQHLDKGIRLKLLNIAKIAIVGSNTLTEPYYAFEYDTLQLPYRLSPTTDYYGYYNGQWPTPHIRKINGVNQTYYLGIPYPASPGNSYGGFIVPQTYLGSTNFGLVKDANFTYTGAATLKKIKNGIGGEITLTYAAPVATNPTCSYNDLQSYTSDYNNSSIIGCNFDADIQGATCPDGLVVTKITYSNQFNALSATNDNNKTYTEYVYSAGERFHRGGYFWYPDLSNSNHYPIYTNSFVGPHNYVKGSNHGFSLVTVKNRGFNSKLLTSSNYYFTNLMYKDAGGNTKSWITKPTGIKWHTMPADMKKYKMGLLIRREDFDENSVLTKKIENTYEDVVSKTYSTWATYYNNIRHFGANYWIYLIMDYEHSRITSESTKTYIKDQVTTTLTDSMVNILNYKYDDNDNVKLSTSTDSKGEIYKSYTFYNYDIQRPSGYGVPLYNSLDLMNDSNWQFKLATQNWKMLGTTDSSMISCSILTPRYSANSSGVLQPNTLQFIATQSAHLSEPLSSVDAANLSYINKYAAVINDVSYYGPIMYRESATMLSDYRGCVLEQLNPLKNQYSASIYDSVTMQKICNATNAKFSQIAYTSFEGLYQSASTQNVKGNWNFDEGLIETDAAFTGKKSIWVDRTDQITSKPLTAGKYIVTMWAKSALPPQLSIRRSGSKIYLTPQLQNTVGSWKLYTATIEAILNDYVEINGAPTGTTTPSGSNIDELRLHPYNSLMESYTLEPLFGIRTKNNPNNYVLYYEYDAFGSLYQVRDMRGNILSKTEEVYMGTDVYSDPNSTGTSNTNF